MNKVGYNLNCLGNHEFDYGQEILTKRMKQANFEFICANINTDSSEISKVNPYKIFQTKDSIKIVFWGLLDIDDNGKPESHPNKLQNLTFQDEFETAKKYTNLSKENNISIILSHMGLDKDSIFATENTNFDLIIGGHSHDLISPIKDVNGVKITQAGAKLKFVGETTIMFANNSIISITDSIINMKDITSYDSLLMADIRRYNNNEELKKVIGKAKNEISGLDNLGSFYTDAIVSEMGVDFCFQNNGGIRILSLKKGDITLNNIYQMDPFGNEMIKINMTLDEIKSLIAFSYQQENCIELQVSGLKYTVYVDEKNKLQRIELLSYNNKQLAEKTYSVALNSYIVGAFNFIHKDEGKSMYVTSASIVIEYLKHNKIIDYTDTKRAFVKKIN